MEERITSQFRTDKSLCDAMKQASGYGNIAERVSEAFALYLSLSPEERHDLAMKYAAARAQAKLRNSTVFETFTGQRPAGEENTGAALRRSEEVRHSVAEAAAQSRDRDKAPSKHRAQPNSRRA